MSIYCVYITFYRGKILPPFYIGYSTVDNVMNGYHGTVKSKAYSKIWKTELRENNSLFKTVILSTHTTKEKASQRETSLQRKLNVHINPLYINRAINGENFFRKSGEYTHTEETKRKIGSANSKRMKGNVPWNKGTNMSKEQKEHLSKINIGKVMNEETKTKISKSLKGRKKSKSHIENISKSSKGKKRNSSYIHPFKGKSRSEETRKKISDSLRKNPVCINYCLHCQTETQHIFCSFLCKKSYVCVCPHCAIKSSAGGLGAMKRFHFENCKSLLTLK